ncbi:MAG: amidohydrolase [Crocinitomicaceae bacterium]|nr:amidohydrolase [Crocinitomicaceae bacterium]
MKQILNILAVVLCLTNVQAQSPSKVLLVNGTLHVGNGDVQESAVVAIIDGKISFVKNSLAYTIEPSEWDSIIELDGRHIYPGFVAPNSTLGITEIDAVRATEDYDEVGIYNPHIRSQIAYNVESKVISTVRTNGVLITQPTPRGGTISGTSSVMKTYGWNWEDATIAANDGIHLNWPESTQGGHWWSESPQIERSEDYAEEKQAIYDFFAMARAYASTSSFNKTADKDLRLEHMRACFKGGKRVYIHAEDVQQLVDIIEFVKEFDLKYPVIVGGYDSHLITRKLADAKIPVMLGRLHSLPYNEADDVDLPYKLPALLMKGGVKFCLQNEGDMEAMNARNMPFLAGTAMAYGLTEEEAISSISLWSCEIMGIDKLYGSIEKGKSATLFVSDGNALDMRSNNLFMALVDGEFMPLSNTQAELFKKYTNKYVD